MCFKVASPPECYKKNEAFIYGHYGLCLLLPVSPDLQRGLLQDRWGIVVMAADDCTFFSWSPDWLSSRDTQTLRIGLHVRYIERSCHNYGAQQRLHQSGGPKSLFEQGNHKKWMLPPEALRKKETTRQQDQWIIGQHGGPQKPSESWKQEDNHSLHYEGVSKSPRSWSSWCRKFSTAQLAVDIFLFVKSSWWVLQVTTKADSQDALLSIQ